MYDLTEPHTAFLPVPDVCCCCGRVLPSAGGAADAMLAWSTRQSTQDNRGVHNPNEGGDYKVTIETQQGLG